MSGASGSRAAVFTGQPQAVEVYQAEAWWSGELLGWRHGRDGSCQVWVRVTLGGAEETAWTDLAALRLPERHLDTAPEPSSAEGASSPTTREISRVDAPRRNGSAPAGAAATTSMPARSAVPVAPRPGGRRRAPESPEETVVAAAVATAPRPAGRHRVVAPPVDAGRHRGADPAPRQVVPEVAPAASVPSVRPTRPSRSDVTVGGHSGSAVGERERGFLTQPMRLSDHLPHAHRTRPDGPCTAGRTRGPAMPGSSVSSPTPDVPMTS